jgi:hypothetical protein
VLPHTYIFIIAMITICTVGDVLILFTAFGPLLPHVERVHVTLNPDICMTSFLCLFEWIMECLENW